MYKLASIHISSHSNSLKGVCWIRKDIDALHPLALVCFDTKLENFDQNTLGFKGTLWYHKSTRGFGVSLRAKPSIPKTISGIRLLSVSYS